MLTISIIFAILVALWGFSGALVSHAKRGLAQAKLRAASAADARPAAAPRAPARRTRPAASA
jgi:hypothetical protein